MIQLTYKDVRCSCISHIIQIGIEGFMGKVTKKAALETAQAIWEYNPKDADALINGTADIIAKLRTLAVKVSAVVLLCTIDLPSPRD